MSMKKKKNDHAKSTPFIHWLVHVALVNSDFWKEAYSYAKICVSVKQFSSCYIKWYPCGLIFYSRPSFAWCSLLSIPTCSPRYFFLAFTGPLTRNLSTLAFTVFFQNFHSCLYS